MTSRWLNLPVGVSGYGVACLVAVLVVVIRLSRSSKLDAIPTVGSSSWLGSWWAGLKFMVNGLEVIEKGYEKHKKAPFKVAVFDRWLVVVSSREHVEEMRKAPDDTLSFLESSDEQVQVEYTMAPEIHHNPYHIAIVRSQMTRNIGTLYPEIRSEITTAFDDILDLKGNKWKSVPALSTVQKVICRTSNRLFVGPPLCRHPDWIDLNIQYTLYVAKGALILRLFPAFLKPLAARFFTNVNEGKARGRKLLGPVIEERLRQMHEYGKQWADKPNDFLSWLIDETESPERTVQSLTTRILAVNLVAIFTSSLSFTHALFYLAEYPQYIQPLREEVEAVIEEEGWSRAALGKMRKVDSFLKECQRMKGVTTVTLVRSALKDFTFADGTFIPKGTTIGAAARGIHYDEAVYPNPHVFEPFRFVDVFAEDEGVTHQFISTTPEYLAFGHGRHACPGRFFAADELKSMLAHIVVTYDVKLEDDAPRPRTRYIGTSVVPDANAKVMFRRRVA